MRNCILRKGIGRQRTTESWVWIALHWLVYGQPELPCGAPLGWVYHLLATHIGCGAHLCAGGIRIACVRLWCRLAFERDLLLLPSPYV